MHLRRSLFDYHKGSETGESKVEEQNFGWALERMKGGEAVCRKGWREKGWWVFLVTPSGSSSSMTLPFLAVHTVYKELLPWLPSQLDVLATDWKLCPQ